MFAFLILFQKNGFCENVLEEFSQKNGELSDMTLEFSKGNTDFKGLFSFFKNLFFKEFFSLKNIFVTLAMITVISSLAECISLDKSILKTVNLCMNGIVVLCSSKFATSLFLKAEETVTQINDFTFFCVPYYCSFLCALGKPLSASKGSLISLGSGNILSELITKVFFPLAHLFYIICISSSLMENDVFKSLKKMFQSMGKLVLPTVVGLYTTVLTIFLKTSSAGDTLVFKTAKTALSSTIPFLGNILTQSADAVVSSVEVVRSQIGVAGVICVIYILFSPLVKLLVGMFMFRVFSSLACFLGNEKKSELFCDMASVTEIYASVTGTMGIVALITVMILTN